eukprot:CAMPEP_0115040104 /NCGR_PEP_ID=MMETSP0216-20121206/44581_1 /TAXON_ID=223996 /ORGANISM="Protocruzia adherens, Strain Boccale" /LENGTH=124 /DNA_ID=CAMNT_0002421183 /DNA_START=522 /DNA_END=893 /DNA_ORIENTATION=+
MAKTRRSREMRSQNKEKSNSTERTTSGVKSMFSQSSREPTSASANTSFVDLNTSMRSQISEDMNASFSHVSVLNSSYLYTTNTEESGARNDSQGKVVEDSPEIKGTTINGQFKEPRDALSTSMD